MEDGKHDSHYNDGKNSLDELIIEEVWKCRVLWGTQTKRYKDLWKKKETVHGERYQLI